MANFSLVSFSQQWNRSDSSTNAYETDQVKAKRAQEKLGFIAKQVRERLLRQPAQDSEDAVQDMDLINRSVLGFAAERQLMRKRIEEVLLQLGMVDCQDPTGIYTCLAEAVFAEVIGFNVLEKLLAEKDKIDEIQVVGERIFEIRGGIEYLSAYQFSHVSQVERLQQNLVLFNHDLMNHGKRWAEVQLTDGSRVSMTGFGFSSVPTLTIRFYSHHCWNLERLVTLGAMDNGVKSLLMSSLMNRLNMVLIGPTNSGKTMLLKALVSELPDSERLITIESRRELMLHRDFPNKNVIEYEIDESDVQHDGAQAFKLALRQSPRRIIHAEIRDTDANLYVRACTRGHNGSMTTLHASSLEDVPDVIAEMCMQDGRSYDADVLALRIARYVVQIGIETGQLDSSGTRGIKRIVQYEVHAGKLCLVELVKYDSAKNKWSLPTTAPKRAVG